MAYPSCSHARTRNITEQLAILLYNATLYQTFDGEIFPVLNKYLVIEGKPYNALVPLVLLFSTNDLQKRITANYREQIYI